MWKQYASQRALWQTQLAGAPEEYFIHKYIEDFSKRFSDIDLESINYSSVLKHLYQLGTSPNGVFGIKLHGQYLKDLIEKDADVHSLLEEPIYIWMRRRDVIRQAISRVLAIQTGI